MEHPTDNHVVDVTEHFEAKMAALLCHESQHPDPERIRRAMHDKLTATAVEHGLAEAGSARSSRSTGCRSGPRLRPHPARCAGCRPSTSPAAAHPCSPRSSGPACSPRVTPGSGRRCAW